MNKAFQFQKKHYLIITLILVIIGQISFFFYSPKYSETKYASRIYSTTGVKHKQEDLHKLNEAAHYFGQTIIGWLKFPSFMEELSESVNLPEETSVYAHIQERQNLVFVINSPNEIESDNLIKVKDFVQGKIDEYNKVSQTEFVLTNLDYEQSIQENSYKKGAGIALLASLIIGLGIYMIKEI